MLAWSTAHRDAVTDLVLSAFPTATVRFSEPARSVAGACAAQGGVSLLQQAQTRLRHMSCGTDRQEPAMSSTLYALPDYCSAAQPYAAARGDGSGAGGVCCALRMWQALYDRYGPRWQPSLARGLAPPHCPWRCYADALPHGADGGDDHARLSVRVVPSWVPHAVVAVGGVEAVDVRRVLAPRLIDGLPGLDELPLTPEPTYAAARAASSADTRLPKARSPLVSHRTQLPRYLRDGMYDTQVTLQHKGCGVRGGNLVELSVPVVHESDDGACTHGEMTRVRTFVTFADPDTTLRDLCVERDATRRMFLRGAFGYSLSLLQQALPPPLVAAVRALRGWQTTGESQLVSSRTQPSAPLATAPCSSAFWVSLVAHVLTYELQGVHNCLVDCMNGTHDAPHGVDDALRRVWHKEEEQQALAAIARLVDDAIHGTMTAHSVPHSSLPPAAAEAESCVLSHVLALASVRALRAATTDRARRARYRVNFFLPGETFEHCDDVTRLLEHCPCITPSAAV